MSDPQRPTLNYQRAEGIPGRMPRSVWMTLSGLVFGAFFGLVAGCIIAVALVGGPGPVPGDLLSLVLIPCIGIGAAVCAFAFGRGAPLRFVAAKEIYEDLQHCGCCNAQTWHVIRIFDFGRRSIECMSCGNCRRL